MTCWRRGRDSNPRYPSRYGRFRGGSFQPLTHLSASAARIVDTALGPSTRPPFADSLRISAAGSRRVAPHARKTPQLSRRLVSTTHAPLRARLPLAGVASLFSLAKATEGVMLSRDARLGSRIRSFVGGHRCADEAVVSGCLPGHDASHKQKFNRRHRPCPVRRPS